MTQKNPLVSILIVAFNPGAYLRQTLESCLAQSYENTEILLLDNASSEDISRHIPEGTGEKITLVRSKKNLGSYGGLNFLLARAGGKYIAIQDHDDIWHPKKLERQIEFLESHPEFEGCGTNTLMYYESDRKYFEYFLDETNYYTIHPSLIFRNRKGLSYDISGGNYFADGLFTKEILCGGAKKIYNLSEALTLHIIKASAGNYSYSWYRLNSENIRRAYTLHPPVYATLSIVWEVLMRKGLYPILNAFGCDTWITRMERIPFILQGKKVYTRKDGVFDEMFVWVR